MLFIHLILVIVVFVFPTDFLQSNVFLFFIIQSIIFVLNARAKTKSIFYINILSPCCLTLIYLQLNFILGSYFIYREYGLQEELIDAVIDMNIINLRISLVFFLLCNLIVYNIFIKRLSKYKVVPLQKNVLSRRHTNSKALFLMFILILLFFIDINLEFLGGVTDKFIEGAHSNFNYSFALITYVVLLYIIRNKGIVYKVCVYFGGIVYFTLTSFQSKREVFVVFIAMLLFESMFGFLNKLVLIKFKTILYGLLLAISLVIVVLFSSINRGYGNYQLNSFMNAFHYIPDYIRSDIFVDAAVGNFEVNSVYGNSINGMNYILNDDIPLLFGSTYAKVFFVIIPSSILPNKPKPMLDYYTNIFNPSFRSGGGSYPIIAYDESFANFGIFGFAILYVLFFYIEKIYYSIVFYARELRLSIVHIMCFFPVLLWLFFVRGDGLNALLLPVIITIPLLLIYYLLLFDQKKHVL